MNGETDKAYDKLKSKQDRSEKAKGVLRGAGYARGGGVSPAKAKTKDQDDAIETDGTKEKQKPKQRVGGTIEGFKPLKRADKFARGGSVAKGHHTKININVGASQADKAAAMKQGVSVGAKLAAQKLMGAGGAGGTPAGGPRPGAGAPPMARPGGMSPGASGGMPPGAGGPPPGGMPPGAGAPPPMGAARGGRTYKRGGKVLKMDAGAGGGEGRLEKIRKYGTKPKS